MRIHFINKTDDFTRSFEGTYRNIRIVLEACKLMERKRLCHNVFASEFEYIVFA